MPCAYILSEHRLSLPGFNASIAPSSTGHGWVGTNRIQTVLKHLPGFPKYPEVMNQTLFFRLDDSFRVTEAFILDDSVRPKQTSWSTGIEDCRLLNEHEGICVACDTNSSGPWRPEVCLFQLGEESILNVRPIPSPWSHQPQKNWIPLTRQGESVILLQQSGHPFRIISYTPSTHSIHICKEYECPQLPSILHNGAAVAVEEGYLVTARCKKGYAYDGSIWILLGHDFTCIGYSAPFYFHEGSSYEMCMSLWFDSNELIASVGFNDRYSSILRLDKRRILESIQRI